MENSENSEERLVNALFPVLKGICNGVRVQEKVPKLDRIVVPIQKISVFATY